METGFTAAEMKQAAETGSRIARAMSRKQLRMPSYAKAQINYNKASGLWELWEYGMQQGSTFTSIQQLADYLRDYPQQLLMVYTPKSERA